MYRYGYQHHRFVISRLININYSWNHCTVHYRDVCAVKLTELCRIINISMISLLYKLKQCFAGHTNNSNVNFNGVFRRDCCTLLWCHWYIVQYHVWWITEKKTSFHELFRISKITNILCVTMKWEPFEVIDFSTTISLICVQLKKNMLI